MNGRPQASAHAAVEEPVVPPVDLRLVPMALAVWLGTLLVCSGWLRPSITFWWALAAGFLIAAGWLVGRRAPRRAGCAAASMGFIASLAISGLYWTQAADDPLSAAAGRHQYTTIRLTIAATPQLVTGAVGGVSAGSESGSAGPGGHGGGR